MRPERLRMVDPAGFIVDIALSVYDNEAEATIAKKLESGFLVHADCDMSEVERRREAHAQKQHAYSRTLAIDGTHSSILRRQLTDALDRIARLEAMVR